jgi:flagellar basal-body rod modification protein FlgD
MMIEGFNQSTAIAPAQENASAASPSVGSSLLGQQDFLTLMTAQLKNQDPLKPMESGDFLAQMAQFSTVAGIEQVNETLAGLSEGMRDMRIGMARDLLGQQVLVPGDMARADTNGAVHGAVDLAEPADGVSVRYSDPESGAVLHNQALGAQPAGRVHFEWRDAPPEWSDEGRPLRVSVHISEGKASHEASPMVYAKVLSAQTSGGASDVTLQIEDYGALKAEDVEAFR